MKHNKFFFGVFVTFVAFCLFFFFFFGFGTTQAYSTMSLKSKKVAAYYSDSVKTNWDHKDTDKLADYTTKEAKQESYYHDKLYVATYKEQKSSKVEAKYYDKSQYLDHKSEYGEQKLEAKHGYEKVKDAAYYYAPDKDYGSDKGWDVAYTTKSKRDSKQSV